MTTAIIIGASMAGLVTAAVAAKHFAHVIILEKDPLPKGAKSRPGVPQGNHVHNLLSRGDATLGRLFPSLAQQLETRGAQRVDWSNDVRWHHHGVWKTRVASGIESWFMSRPMLEDCVRGNLLSQRNVTCRDSISVDRLLLEADTATGVRLNSGEVLGADLVIDCSGRRSGLFDAIVETGFPEPPVQRIASDVVYATRLIRPRAPQPFKALVQVAPPPGKRSAVTFAIEDGLWMFTLFGYHSDHPPKDNAGFQAFAESLIQPDIPQLLASSDLVSDVKKYHFRESLWRRFDQVTRAPKRVIHLGDAVCSFNPIYGQGMTSATLQAEALANLLARTALDDLHTKVPGALAAVIKECWAAVASEDFRHPETTGDKMSGAAAINWYTRRVHRRASVDAVTETAFLKVMHMEKGFGSLFHPRVLLPALLSPI